MESSIVSVNVDIKKMPLGQLSRETVLAGYKVLRELEDANAGRANEENSRSRACRAYRAARRRALDRWLEHLAT